MKQVRKALTAAVAGVAAYLVAALTQTGAHFSVALLGAALLAGVVAGLSTWRVPNASAEVVAK